MSAERVERIRARVAEALDAGEVEVIDEGHKHIGHAGAATGLGHFALRLRSPRFAGTSTLARHRMVYDALGEMMTTDIHAISIRALAPDE